MTLDALNALPEPEAIAEMLKCCGSLQWARGMAWARPFASSDELFKTADFIWTNLRREDWMEAFRHHPKIGAKAASGWASQEQKGVSGSAQDVLDALARENEAYEKRFGYIYLVCATGKSGSEMLDILRKRIRNEPDVELRVAAGEQARITRLRLEKLLSEGALT